MQCVCKGGTPTDEAIKLQGETLAIVVVSETNGTAHKIQLDEYSRVSDIAGLVEDASLSEHMTMCRFADHVMQNDSTLNENGIKTGATVYLDIDFETEKKMQEEAVRAARKKRQAEFSALQERRTLLNELDNMIQSGVFADLNRRSDHIGATVQLYKGGIETTFSRFLLAVSLCLLALGIVGAIWMLRTGIQYGGDDCDWSTRNHVGLVSACIYTYGLIMMHLAGPNYVLPCLLRCQGSSAWFRIMNISALCIIFPVLQWGWVVWGQDETECADYMKNVKIAFYMSAMSVFFVTFITPLLRQRYMRNCENTIVTEQGVVQFAIDNADVEYHIDIMCFAEQPEHNVRLHIQIDHSAKVDHILTLIGAVLSGRAGFENLVLSQSVLQVVSKQNSNPDTVVVDSAFLTQLLGFDYLVHRIDELADWEPGPEFHAARVLIDFASVGTQEPWAETDSWLLFLENWDQTQQVECNNCVQMGVLGPVNGADDQDDQVAGTIQMNDLEDPPRAY